VSLRRRLTVTVAASVAVAVVVAAVAAYVVTRAEFRGQVDDQLKEQVGMVPPREPGPDGPLGGPAPGFELPPLDDQGAGRPAALRVTNADGTVVAERGELPEAPEDLGSEPVLEDTDVDDEHLRLIYAQLPGGGSIALGRSLESVDDALGTLRGFLFLVAIGGTALAALGARLIAGRLLIPVGRLTEAAEHVSETEDLSRRIEVDGEDEVAQLGNRFNSMLERLEASRHELDSAHDEQRRLIADASHELRTPVTALRTNIEVIARGGLAADDEHRALEAASAQAEELGILIGDLMDLARGEPADLEFEEVRLDELVAESVDRARRNAPEVTFELESEPAVVSGSPERIARAVNNLLDNAAQHGGGAPVEVGVNDGAVSVRDHGPGVAAEDAERLFDRFYRGQGARRRPGSGLGLAIVRQVADSHGGTVGVATAEGGGAVFTLLFPG
jgi:two-component system sensor histidine kinase MprB